MHRASASHFALRTSRFALGTVTAWRGVQIQLGKYEQQLERHREKSRNEKAELEKVKMQYKMLEMDLLANTASGQTEDDGLDRAAVAMVRFLRPLWPHPVARLRFGGCVHGPEVTGRPGGGSRGGAVLGRVV